MISRDQYSALGNLLSVREISLWSKPQKSGDRSGYLNEIVAEIIKQRFLLFLVFQVLFLY